MMTNRSVPIAIVGIACRFPGAANNPRSFWEIVSNKTDCVGPIPNDRWDRTLLDGLSAAPESQFAQVGGFVDGIDQFDPAFFNISPREAAEIDPQQRMLLDMSWQCMEDAATGAETLARLRTGVYVGVINHDYERLILSDRKSINAFSGLGRSTSIAANRISYCFNLAGPSIAIDTACSSSLTAVDWACRALASQTVDYAFAGGANAILLPESYIEFSQAAMLSKTGQCRAFDEKADGFVRAEGGGLILLKRLSDALVDNDKIYASIIATSVNQDGKTVGIMAPSLYSQQAMMREALNQCGINASDIGYVEAHGTGTQLGDTVEAKSLGTVYEHSSLPVGSVKTNIGHTEAAAGIAGLIKATLAVRHGEIPPNLHFAHPNPNIDFATLGIRIPVNSEKWHNTNGRPRVAAVNSFGFGGANAHAIIQQAPDRSSFNKTADDRSAVIPVSARSPESLESLKTSVSELVNDSSTPLDCLSYTASRKSRHKFRTALTVSAINAKREQVNFGQELARRRTAFAANESDHKFAFVFSGIGTQWNGEGAKLYATEPVFSTTVDLCDSLFDKKLNVRDAFATATKFKADDLIKAHAVHFTLQLALHELWSSWGVIPDAVVGHSMGEVAAACSAGYIDLPSAVNLVYERASRLQPYANKGAMLAAAIDLQRSVEIIKEHPDQIALAAVNSAKSVTFSGIGERILYLANSLTEAGVFNRILAVPVPFHSPIIEDACVERSALPINVKKNQQDIDWFSSVTGSRLIDEFRDPSFWGQNFAAPVMFADCLKSAMDSGVRLFVEIGPHASLNYNIHECLQEKGLESGQAVYSIHRDQPEDLTMRTAAAALFGRGVELDFERINSKARVCDFPKAEFQRQTHWKSRTAAQVPGQQPDGNRYSMLGAPTTENPTSWKIALKIDEWTWLKNHRLRGEVIFPASGYVEAALETASSYFESRAIELHSVQFTRLLKLSPPNGVGLEITTRANGKVHQFDITSRNLPADSNNVILSRGNFARGKEPRPGIPATEFGVEPKPIMSSEVIDEQLDAWGFEGDTSRWHVHDICRTGKKDLLATLRASSKNIHSRQRYLLDPSLLDLCFRCVLGLTESRKVLLPYEVDRLQFWQDSPDEVQCHIHLISNDSDSLALNMAIANTSGQVIAKITNLQLRSCEFAKDESTEQKPSIFAIERHWKIHRYAAGDEPRFGCNASELQRRLEDESSALMQAHQRLSRCEKALPALTEITVAYIEQALLEACLLLDSRKYSFEELEIRCKVTEEQQTLFRSLLMLLADCGHLELTQQRNGETQTTLVKRRKEFNSAPSLSVANFLKLPESAEYTNELLLIDRCGSNLLSVLNGKQTGLDTLFPDGSADLLKNFYQSSPTCRVYNEILQRSVEILLESWTLARPCRILEVGGGTGAQLFHLAPVLKTHEVEYTFTDISSLFVRRARSRFEHLNFASFAELDFDSDPVAQGFQHHQFDLILASDALHLAYSPLHALQRLNNLLRPGGFLNFVELTNEPTWARLVFGMLRDWWPKDTTNRSTVSPCLSRTAWLQILSESNYENVATLGDPESGGESMHTVFVTSKIKGNSAPVPKPSCSDQARLVFCGGDQFSTRFLERFKAENTRHVLPGDQFARQERDYVIDPAKPGHYAELIKDLRRNEQLPEEIIFLWNFSSAQSTTPPSAQEQLTASPVLAAAYLIQAFDSQGLTPKPLRFITSNAHKVDSQTSLTDCLNAALWGFGRTLGNEYPGLDTKLIDIDVSQDSNGEGLFEFLMSESELTEVCLRGAGQYISTESELDAESLAAARPAGLVLSTDRRGDLQSLRYRARGLPSLSDSEVTIQVSAASLNFRDVMIALDALPETAVSNGYMQRSLGIECSGTIIKTGKDVRDLHPGDRVVALAKNSLASTVTTDRKFACKISRTDWTPALTNLPTAYATALYCLEETVKINATDRILIHCASGGVGLALVNIAKKYGPTIYATAGTADKKRYLNLVGVKHVADSRSKSYVDDVNEWTNGEGVDLVVNTLGGDLAAANKAILAKDGILVELGKYENRDDIHREIKQANPTAKIVTVDIDSLWQKSPQIIQKLFVSVIRKAADNDLPLLPYQEFPALNAVEAFQHMASAAHIGKVMVSMNSVDRQSKGLQHLSAVKHNATYVVAGGTRGFGLATARWLAEHGAQYVVVLGRSPESSRQLKVVEDQAAEAGCTIEAFAADITDIYAVRGVMSAVSETMPPIRGVFHCAMEIEDSAVVNLRQDSFIKSTFAKVIGAWNLYQTTGDSELDFFVLYSSVTAVLAPAGQAAYSAANSCLDAMASYLRQEGVPAISINWGAVSDYGHVADNPNISTAVSGRFGIHAFPARDLLANLKGLLDCSTGTQVVVAAGTWPSTERAASVKLIADQMEPSNGSEAGEKKEMVLDCISQVLDLPKIAIDPDEPVVNLGLDSLLAVELSHLLRTNCQIEVSASSLLDQISIGELLINT